MSTNRFEERVRQMFAKRWEIWGTCMLGPLAQQAALAAEMITRSLNDGGKMLVFGNGGSAAEAQHFAAELVGRFERDRRALPAIALTTDTSIITAQANDSGYETIFSRQIEALAKPEDVVVGMTTSDVRDGHSENIRRGFLAARSAGCSTIGFFSEKTNELLQLTDISLIVPDSNTARIQEVHLALIHVISALVEEGVS